MTTIAISSKTRNRLKQYFTQYGDTYEVILNRFMDEKKPNNKRQGKK